MAQFGSFEFGRAEFGAPVAGGGVSTSPSASDVLAPAISESALFTNLATHARVTQLVRETLQQGGNPNARLTQIAVETLVRLALKPAAETLAPAFTENAVVNTGAPAAGVLVTQDVLEAAESPDTQLWVTQAALETIQLPAAPLVYVTQAALEAVKYPSDTKVLTTQTCLEVVLPGTWTGPPPIRRPNHSFLGVMATGHKANASFVS